MKTKLFFAFLLGVLLLGVSCSNEDEIRKEGDGDGGKATLIVNITGKDMNTRALPATPATEEENAIKDYTIYVFYANGVLEASSTTATLANLSTGNKRIAVVVNEPDGFPQSPITNYADFENEVFDLETQSPQNMQVSGLTMSGEIAPKLNAGENVLTIPVSRVVAKIKLGTVTVTPDAVNGGEFILTNVNIMKAKSSSNVGLPTIKTNVPFYGGVGPDATLLSDYKSFLRGVAKEGTNDSFFYVFPNDGVDATLMTLEGTYNGTKTYFPFIINDPTSNPTDGTYIKRNTVHTVNVILKKVWTGSENPEELVDESSINVTIEAQDWETIPSQDVEW